MGDDMYRRERRKRGKTGNMAEKRENGEQQNTQQIVAPKAL